MPALLFKLWEILKDELFSLLLPVSWGNSRSRLSFTLESLENSLVHVKVCICVSVPSYSVNVDITGESMLSQKS